MKNMFEKVFAPLNKDYLKISMDGNIAVMIADPHEYAKLYNVYDIDEKKLIDCTDFCFDLPENSLFTIPTKTTELSIGDIVFLGKELVPENIYCIINIDNAQNELTAINYTTGTKEIILPQYFFFMKNTAFLLKIVNLFGNMFNGFNKDNKDNNMINYFMMSKMMDGKSDNIIPMMFMMNGENMFNGFDKDNNMINYFMMSKMMNGKSDNIIPMMFMMNGGNMFGKKQTTTKSEE